tara:strand:+ start:132 stop:1019 length:888 start_codon:yes stop_codon:yes gene_type:complete
MQNKIKSVIQLFISKLLIFFIGIVKGFLVPGILGAKTYGIIQYFSILQTVLSFSGMGFNAAYIRLLPDIKKGNNPEVETSKLQNLIFSFLFIASLVSMFVTIMVPFLIKPFSYEDRFMMTFCFIVIAITHFFTLIGSFFFQSQYIEKNFSLIFKINIFQSIFSIFLILVSITYWGIYGFFIAEFFTVLATQGIYYYNTNIKLKFQLGWESFKEIFNYSFPFFIGNVGFYFMRLADKSIISFFFTFRDLGFYGFAANLVEQCKLISVSISDVIIPHFIDDISQISKLEDLKKKLRE